MKTRYFCSLAATCVICLVSLSARPDVDPDSFPKNLRAMEWREVGPYRGGRSAAVAGIPSQREIYYFGATGGGVWKTRNAGVGWENISDGFFGGSIGAVAVSEWDPNVVYVGVSFDNATHHEARAHRNVAGMLRCAWVRSIAV